MLNPSHLVRSLSVTFTDLESGFKKSQLLWDCSIQPSIISIVYFSLHVAVFLVSILLQNVWHSQSAIKLFHFIFTISRLFYQRAAKVFT